MAPEAPAAPADQKETIIHFNKTVACRLLNIVSGSRNLDYGIGGGEGERPGAALMCQPLGVDADVAAAAASEGGSTASERCDKCSRSIIDMGKSP